MDPKPVRITVVKRTLNKEEIDTYTEPYRGKPWDRCDIVHEGQQWVTDGRMPEGFCSFAWADILQYVLVLARGGNFVGVSPGTFVTCCTDGFRPVIFKVERIEGEAK